MRKTLVILFIFVYVMPFAAHAQTDIATSPDSIFNVYTVKLKNKGNECYMLSDRLGIRDVLDEYAVLIEKRKREGLLTPETEQQLRQDTLKLAGAYHYENSDYDERSYVLAEQYYKVYRDYYQEHQVGYVERQGLYIAHLELAQLYYKQSRYQEALEEMEKAKPSFSVYAKDDNDEFDRLAQYALCLARVREYKKAIAQIDEVIDNYEGTNSERYGEALRKKAKILMLEEENEGEMRSAEALKLYREYYELKKIDALAHFMDMNSGQREQYWMRIRPFVTDCYRLENADAGFLYDVTLFAKGLLLQLDSLGGGRQNINVTWKMIQKKLKPNACAIEFVQYEKFGRQQMGALLLKQTGTPVFIKMASPDSVWNFEIGGRTLERRLQRTDRGNFQSIDNVYNDSLGVFRKIWNEELVTAIGDSKSIYFAPDGYLHRIAIEYMLPEELSKCELFRLSSTRRLLEIQQYANHGKALIVGDVDYNSAKMFAEGNNDAYAYKRLGRVQFGLLEKSKEEIESIRAIRNNPSDSLLCSESATEQDFRSMCGNYPIIHVSSHGKYMAKDIPIGTDVKPCLTDASLSESIIALAGINKTLDDDSFDPESTQDGVLSAKEIASLNMKDVQIAIMACCETGLGHVTSDGVYGIQRGLKNAGVGAIVMALWEADDNMTSTFMTSLHKRISEGKPFGRAFRETRESFLAMDDDNFNRPRYRNVFVVIDALE